jgi:hypothetical protein
LSGGTMGRTMGHDPQRSGWNTLPSIWLGWLLFVLLLAGLPTGGRGQAPSDPTASEIAGVLAREKTVAEEFARLLNDQGRGDAVQYAQGIRRYGLAKAQFDGLIEQMQFALQAGEPPDTSSQFQVALRSAVDARVAFTNFIDETILTKQPPGARSPVGEVIKGAGELLKVVSDATLAAWRDYRTAAETRRRDLIARLDTYRWRPFGEIAGGR